MSVSQVLDYVIITVPEQLKRTPETWDPRLEYQLGSLNASFTVGLADWALSRVKLDDIVSTISGANYGKALILCPSEKALVRAVQLQRRVKNSFILGVPKRDDIAWEKWCGETNIDADPRTSWRDIGVDFYYKAIDNRIQYTIETGMWERTAPLMYRLPKRVIKPEKVAERMLHSRAVHLWDSAIWYDNLTDDWNWTRSILAALEHREFEFPFIAYASYDKIEKSQVIRLRESGCRGIRLGRIPMQWLRSTPTYTRLQGAVTACSEAHVPLDLDWLVDSSTGYEDMIEASKVARSWSLAKRPEVEVPYSLGIEELEKIHTRGFYNPNPDAFTDVELMGLLNAVETGQGTLKRLS